MKNIPVFLLTLHILLVMLFNGKVDIKFIEKMVVREDLNGGERGHPEL